MAPHITPTEGARAIVLADVVAVQKWRQSRSGGSREVAAVEKRRQSRRGGSREVAAVGKWR
jgi:hypothetical protein